MFLSRAVTVEQDLQAGRAVVKIEDPKVRKQREMWGAYLNRVRVNDMVAALLRYNQEPLAPTSRTTSSACRKGTLRS